MYQWKYVSFWILNVRLGLDIFLQSVFSLVEDSPRGVNDCREPSLGLEELLNQRLQDLKGREESLVNAFSFDS